MRRLCACCKQNWKKKASFRAIRVCYEKCVRKACILTKWRVWGEDWSCVKQRMGACFGLYCFFRFYTSCFSPSLLGFQASNQDIFDFLSLSQCINIPQNIWFSFSRMITCTFLPFSTSSLILFGFVFALSSTLACCNWGNWTMVRKAFEIIIGYSCL